MTACAKCGAESIQGQRWCKRCHSNLGDPTLVLASPMKRLGAAVIDAVIPGFFYALFLPIPFVSYDFAWVGSITIPMISLVIFLAYLVWVTVLFGKGRTPGKLLVNIRVIRADGRDAGLGVMVVRSVVGKFISALVFYLGFVWILIDENRQAWHDKLVDTFIVENRV